MTLAVATTHHFTFNILNNSETSITDVNFIYSSTKNCICTTPENTSVITCETNNTMVCGNESTTFAQFSGRESPDMIDREFELEMKAKSTTPIRHRNPKRTPTSTKRSTRSNTPQSTKRTKDTGRVLRSTSKKQSQKVILKEEQITQLITSPKPRRRKCISRQLKLDEEEQDEKLEYESNSSTNTSASSMENNTRKRKMQDSTEMTPTKKQRQNLDEEEESLISSEDEDLCNDEDNQDIDDTTSEEDNIDGIDEFSSEGFESPSKSRRKSGTPAKKSTIKKKCGRPRKDGGRVLFSNDTDDRTHTFVCNRREGSNEKRKLPRSRPSNRPKIPSQAINGVISSILFLRRNILPARCCRKSRGRYSLFVILRSPEKLREASRLRLEKSRNKKFKSTPAVPIENVIVPVIESATPRTRRAQKSVTPSSTVKRKRGRPRKYPIGTTPSSVISTSQNSPRIAPRKAKKKNIRKKLF